MKMVAIVLFVWIFVALLAGNWAIAIIALILFGITRAAQSA